MTTETTTEISAEAILTLAQDFALEAAQRIAKAALGRLDDDELEDNACEHIQAQLRCVMDCDYAVINIPAASLVVIGSPYAGYEVWNFGNDCAANDGRTLDVSRIAYGALKTHAYEIIVEKLREQKEEQDTEDENGLTCPPSCQETHEGTNDDD